MESCIVEFAVLEPSRALALALLDKLLELMVPHQSCSEGARPTGS